MRILFRMPFLCTQPCLIIKNSLSAFIFNFPCKLQNCRQFNGFI
nr:MAG TPA: hypothetical protein [Bacteriophage sp.]